MNPTHPPLEPLVSIIIPVCNKWNMTQACLRSIKQHTTATRHEIIVMDNGSTDETPHAVISEFPAVRLIRDDHQLDFSRANNIAVEQARGSILLLLNNDTQVTAGWLPPLMETLLSDTAIAATGPRLLYPDGTVQHAGVIFSFFKSGYHFGAHWDGSHPEVNKRREFKALTAACLCCRRMDFLDAGGFDENFRNGGEDVDLCLKWWSAGRRLVYDPRSTVVHRESQTPGRFRHSMENVRLLMKHWRDTVPQDDLACFAQTRMPQSGVRTIPLVIDMRPAGLLQKVIHKLLASSQCAIPLLIVTDDRANRHARYLRMFAPLITVISNNDLPAMDAWASQWIDDPHFDGLLLIRTPEGLCVSWDRVLSGLAGKDTPIVPIISDGKGMQGVLRYAVNLPATARTSPRQIQNCLKTLLADTVAFTRQASQECVFLPAAYLRTAGAKATGSHLASEKTNEDNLTAVIHSLMIFRDRRIPVEPPVHMSLIFTVAADDPSLRDSIRALRIRLCDTATEIILLDNGSPRTATAVRSLNDVILMRCETTVTRATARNRAALAALGRWLVFADDPGFLTTDVIHGIQTVCAETVPFGGAMGSPVRCGAIPVTCPVLVVDRGLFRDAGQFSVEYRTHLAEIDLCMRIRMKTGGNTRLAITLPATIPAGTPVELPSGHLDPQDLAFFRNRWPSVTVV